MLHNFNCQIIITFLLLGFTSAGQNNLNLSWKRPVSPQDFLYLDYEPRLFQALDFYLERPLRREQFSVGVEVIYAKYHRYMHDHPKNLGGKNDFYDKSFSVGAIGRAYTKPRVWRFYAELGLHGVSFPESRPFKSRMQQAVSSSHYPTQS